MRGWLGVLAVCSLFSAHDASAQRVAPGQQAAQPAAPPVLTPEQRAAQLREVVGLVTSPDRDLNIAQFERIMQSGDARRIELAVRALIVSEDPVLRGMAMRGYIAVTQEIELEVVLSANEMRVLGQARAQPDGVRLIEPPNQHLFLLSLAQFRAKLWFDRSEINDGRGFVQSLPGRITSTNFRTNYVVRGDRITFRLALFENGPVCDFELSPGTDASIDGVIACLDNRFRGPVQLNARMF